LHSLVQIKYRFLSRLDSVFNQYHTSFWRIIPILTDATDLAKLTQVASQLDIENFRFSYRILFSVVGLLLIVQIQNLLIRNHRSFQNSFTYKIQNSKNPLMVSTSFKPLPVDISRIRRNSKLQPTIVLNCGDAASKNLNWAFSEDISQLS